MKVPVINNFKIVDARGNMVLPHVDGDMRIVWMDGEHDTWTKIEKRKVYQGKWIVAILGNPHIDFQKFMNYFGIDLNNY